MKIKSQKDFWSGMMFLVVGVGFAWGALGYSFGSSAKPGPGYFPFGLGVMMALMGAFILFEALTIETADGEPIGAIAWRPMLIIIGSIIGFGLLLPRLGMLVTLPLLIIVSAMADHEFSWKGTLLSAVIITVGSWLVFIKGLSLTIPLLPAFMAG